MTRIFMDINHCGECPFASCRRHWTEDSWEHAFDYFCSEQLVDGNPLCVASYIEWEDEMPKVPDSCPHKL